MRINWPWLLYSAPLIFIAMILAFSANAGWAPGIKLLYAYVTYIFLNCITFTMFMVSHTALLSRITLDGDQRQQMSSINQILNQVGTLAVTTFLVAIVDKVGWTMTAVIYGSAAALYGLGVNNIALVYAGCLLKGIFNGFLFACGFAMAADVVDYGEFKTGVRSEGLINSCVSFGQKVGLGLGPAIVSWVLAARGFDDTVATQSVAALGAIMDSAGSA